MIRNLLTNMSLPFTRPGNFLSRSLLRRLAFLAVVGFTIVGTAQADQLTITYSDPVADQTGDIDVTKMTMVFDNATGNYKIVLRATVAHPFVGLFRVNVNLFNADTVPSAMVFQDVFNDYNLAISTTKLTLTGTDLKLLAWNATDRVATNDLAGLGNPPGTTAFRSSATNFPIGFLTNEDAIAYGVPGLTTVKLFTPQDGIELLADDVTELLENGTLTAGQANGLMSKLNAATASLNKGNTNPACNQLNGFINQVNAFLNSGILSQDQAQALIDAAEAIRTQIGC